MEEARQRALLVNPPRRGRWREQGSSCLRRHVSPAHADILLFLFGIGPVGLCASLRSGVVPHLLVVLVDVRLLSPPAAGLESKHPSEDDTADEVGGRELQRRLA